MTDVSRETFTCVRCGGTWPKGRSDAEAEAEMIATFGTPMPEEGPIQALCDDCYKDFMAWWAKRPRQ